MQPANRSKVGMFDDAPIWSFKTKLEATEDPELARAATHGLFLIEVFPALAIISLELAFFGSPKHLAIIRSAARHSSSWIGVPS